MIDGSHHSYEDNVALTKKLWNTPTITALWSKANSAGWKAWRTTSRSRPAWAAIPIPPRCRTLWSAPASIPWPSPSAPATGLQVQARNQAPAAVRHSGGYFKPPARLPHRAARRKLRHPGIRRDDQPIRRHMPDAMGVPEDMLRKAAAMSVCKINIDSDLRLAMTGTIRKFFAENPPCSTPGLSQARKGRDPCHGRPQDQKRSRLRRQGVKPVGFRPDWGEQAPPNRQFQPYSAKTTKKHAGPLP